MTSERETETNLQDGPAPLQEQPVPASAEAAYERLTSYGFAQRYIKGKVVADIGREGVVHGSRLLAGTAESVTRLTSASETADRALAVYSAPNVSYRTVYLPGLPFSDSSFDVVVAFGVLENLEHPEDLIREAKRVLKQDGVLLLSATDRQTNSIERNRREDADGRREMYVPEFQQMLERHFGHVHMYRQGAVAGGFVFPATGEVTGAPVETARFTLADPRFGVEPPTTRSVIAVCSDTAVALADDEERPYLLLDRDRGVFDESEERAEDVELLRAEIRRMQEIELRALVDALRKEVVPLGILLRLASRVLLSYLYGYWKANLQAMFRRRRDITFEEARRRRELTLEEGRHRRNLVLEQVRHRRNLALQPIRHRRNIIRGNIYAMRKKGPRGMAQGAFKRSYGLYRRLRNKDRSSDSNPRSKYEGEQCPPTQSKYPCGLAPARP
jgi:SAM-dependent methyltransferase